jgi:hypothetical protein
MEISGKKKTYPVRLIVADWDHHYILVNVQPMIADFSI